MHIYRFSPHIYLEPFTEAALLLVADRGLMMKIDQTAADLFEQLLAAIGETPFSRSDVVDFLLARYDMSRPEAERRMRSLLGFGLKHRLCERVPANHVNA